LIDTVENYGASEKDDGDVSGRRTNSGKRLIPIRKWPVALVFALPYGWDIWEGLGNLLGLGPFYTAWGIGDKVPWVLLWAGVLLPVLVFVLAAWLGSKQISILETIVTYLLGWTVVAAVTVSLSTFEQAWRAAAIQALPL